ncbi:MCE family protein [Aestuariicella hydrocarbonica]|uniref:MCE family protein n=1 Tax=Pseudomaricurvus hydrocarbonicus TaxID=1470433 RepID=A0A9E5MJD1_9GAMM|nr:MlaD family protein [Aestuariicella hydrocarbonica]NHO64929.1 MCE family protein [Aestuariicella hydrocarbonica]
MSETEPTIRPKRAISKVWLIPLVALALGVWMLFYGYTNQGPSFQIQFNNADDLVAGKTKIKLLSVDVGMVESIGLNPEANGVIVNATLDKKYSDLLKQDTQFWVERAQIGTSGVSGLSTLLSGAYIKLLPGTSKRKQHTFTGLESAPLTNVNAPGVRLVLTSKKSSAVSTGNPVLFNGYVVGGVESKTLDETTQTIKYDVFIKAPYHQLVTDNVRFWDVSGIAMRASAKGFDVHMGSLDTLLAGGLSFSLPPDTPPGELARDGKEFHLYTSLEETLEKVYRHKVRYVISFNQPVGGVAPGAPVVFRGIPIGQVERVLLKEMMTGPTGKGAAIPILVHIEPGRLELGDSEASAEHLKELIEKEVRSGLRASLKTGNLITGNQLVSLDYYPNVEHAELGQYEQYAQIPTTPGSLAQLQESASMLLDKFNRLPIEDTIISANQAIGQLDASLLSLEQLLQSEGVQTLPSQLNSSLNELNSTLKTCPDP